MKQTVFCFLFDTEILELTGSLITQLVGCFGGKPLYFAINLNSRHIPQYSTYFSPPTAFLHQKFMDVPQVELRRSNVYPMHEL